LLFSGLLNEVHTPTYLAFGFWVVGSGETESKLLAHVCLYC